MKTADIKWHGGVGQVCEYHDIPVNKLFGFERKCVLLVELYNF